MKAQPSALTPAFIATVLAAATQAHGAFEPDESLVRARALAQVVTITRDDFGIAHIHAKTDAGAVFGGMYARAEDEMARIETGHAQSIGMAALTLGPAGIPWDKFILAYEVPERARKEYEEAPADVQSLANAGADALNLYLSLHPEYTPRAIERWEPWMFFARDYGWSLYHAQAEIERLPALLAAPTTPPTPTTPTTPTHPTTPAPEAGETPAPDGSNAWAIAGSRTASGKAMLYLNPHIPLDEPYELNLRSDEGLHVSGMVAYGGGLLPCAGFNRHMGWSLTVNYPDIADTYAIRFDVPGDELAYRHGDEVLHASKWTKTIKVRTAGGGVEEQEITLYKTIHGPLTHSANGVSYAVRTAGLEDLRSIEQWYRMARASTLEEWKSAVSMFGVVFHNLVYADDQGNIGYIYNAAFPKRDPAFDWGGILDGSDPRTDWKGYHELADLPQVWNPPSGYLLNCNSPFFQVTGEGENPDKSRFPKDMVGHDLVDGRIAMSQDLLSNAQKWTLDDLEKAAFDTKVYSLEASRAGLVKDYEALRASSPEKAERIAEAVELIRVWDGRLTLDSVEGTLFMVWVEELFSPQWRTRRATGDLSACLAEHMDRLERDFGTWRVKWGEINRHQRFDSNALLAVSDDRESLPIAGGHGGMGVGFCYLTRAAGTKKRYGFHGHSYVGAVEFGANGPEARSIIPFGISRDPRSKHYADQAPIYAAGRLRGMWNGKVSERVYRPGEEVKAVR
ncbi:MAG: penicillin acylase family protein [Phycisphaerales bacterium]|nr:penicillin acylase family protein [Phycisphaerales bacterium]